MSADESTSDVKHDKKPSKSHRRHDVVRWAVAILESQKDFRNMKLLGSGTYGDVHLMYDPERESAIAVKIVTSDNISESELVLWPKLHHPNIVPLLELLTLSVLDVTIFIMPVQNTTLNDALYERHFITHYNALNKVKYWLYQILCGLEYLHSKGLCHLDIKVDNVLISDASVAMLCDFTFLNVTTKPLERYDLGLPYIYRPPEACHSMGPDILVDGKSYDMWGYGIMSVEIFTHFYLATNVSNCKCWIREVYPMMYKILQEDTFFVLMAKTFLGVHVKRIFAQQALNFVHGFLMVDSQKRISLLEATQHPFLKKGTISGPPPDPVWVKKVPSDDESCEMFKKNCLKNEIKDENFYVEQPIYESEIEDDMDYEAGDEISRQYSNATDYESKMFNVDSTSYVLDAQDLSDDGSVIGEPNRINFMEDSCENTVIDVTSAGDLDAKINQASSSEDEHISKKFKCYKNSLQRYRNCKKESKETWNEDIEISSSEECTETVENEAECESTGEEAVSIFTNVEIYHSEEKSNCSIVENPNIEQETIDNLRAKSPTISMRFAPCILHFLHSNQKAHEHGNFIINDSGNVSLRDFWPKLQPKSSFISEEVSKERHEETLSLKSPSNNLVMSDEKNSKWATGDSIKDADSFEKLSLDEERMSSNIDHEFDIEMQDPKTGSENDFIIKGTKICPENDFSLKDSVTVTRHMKSLRLQLSKLDQMFDEIEKEMVCENCSALDSPEDTEADVVHEKQSVVSDIAASGESCQPRDCQNSFMDILNKEQYDSETSSAFVNEGNLNPSIRNPLFQDIMAEGINENNMQNIIYLFGIVNLKTKMKEVF